MSGPMVSARRSLRPLRHPWASCAQRMAFFIGDGTVHPALALYACKKLEKGGTGGG